MIAVLITGTLVDGPHLSSSRYGLPIATAR